MTRDWRDERIEELTRQLELALARIQELEVVAARVGSLEAQVAKLLEQVKQDSTNSSKPPSSDGPAKAKRKYPKKKPSGRKQGAQVGHTKHARELLPVEQVDSVRVVKAESCSCCAGKLTDHTSNPARHQYCEIPPIKPIVHEIQLHSGWCDTCNCWTLAKLPDGVPTRMFGPSVDSAIGVFIGIYRLSKRQVAAVLGSLFGLTMSVGAIIDSQRAVSQALEQPVMEARRFAEKQPIKNADETSFRENNKRVWLWALVTSLVTIFVIQKNRNADAARELLGAVVGILGTDRYAGYSFWPTKLRQVCWSHLIRDFTAISERDKESKRIGLALLKEAHRMFSWWHRVREEKLKRTTFQVYMSSLMPRVQNLLEQGTLLDNKKSARTCKKILKIYPALWTFVEVEGVEPTNNISEHAVRHPVIIRKLSYGTQSEWGSRFMERILTVNATCNQQNRSVLDFIRQACESKLTGSSAPSLIPESSQDLDGRIAAFPVAA